MLFRSGLRGSFAGTVHTQTEYAPDHAEAGSPACAAHASPEPDRLASFRMAGVCNLRTDLYSAGDAILEKKLERAADFDGMHFIKVPKESEDKVKMKKTMALLTALLLIFSVSLAEDAVSSATLSVDRLPAVESTGSSILVVYFSTNDTIRAAAYTVADALSADLFEIQPVDPYTADDVNYHNIGDKTMIDD